MRASITSLGCLVAVCMLAPATADEPSGNRGDTVAEELVEIPGGRDDDVVPQPLLSPAKENSSGVKQDLAELKQMVRELSERMTSLENTLRSHRQLQMGEPGQLTRVEDLSRGTLIRPQAAANQLPRVIHRIDDLGSSAAVVRHITSKIAPEHWRDAGGPGSLEVAQANGDLIVYATKDVHDEISQWLRESRQAVKAFREASQTMHNAKEVLEGLGLEPERR